MKSPKVPAGGGMKGRDVACGELRWTERGLERRPERASWHQRPCADASEKTWVVQEGLV